MLKKVTDCIFNVFYYKIALMFFLIPTLLVLCVSFNYKLLFIMMGWGAILCFYDLIVRRNFVKARGAIWLIMFLLVFALTVFLNYKTALNLNVSSFAYTVIALFLLYPDSNIKSKEVALKEITAINNIFLGMTTVLSTISLGMFVKLYSYSMTYGDQTYVMGWFQNRLFGVYANMGYMTTAIALALAGIQIFAYKARNRKMSKPYKAFMIYTAIVNFLSMCLENAKAAFISLGVFLAISTFFIISEKLIRKGYKSLKADFISLISAVIAVAIMFGLISTTRPILAYVPNLYLLITHSENNSNSSGADSEPISENETDKNEIDEDVNKDDDEDSGKDKVKDKLEAIEIDRDVPEDYGAFTGRTTIWKFGLEQFLNKPVFGYGPQSHREYFIVDNDLRHFHNLIVQIFVSVGAVGAFFILGFFLLTFIHILLSLFKMRKRGSLYFSVAAVIFAFLGMLLINSMAEVTILFIARFAMFLFWMYMGYIQVFFDEENKTKGTAILEKVNHLMNKVIKGKNEK